MGLAIIFILAPIFGVLIEEAIEATTCPAFQCAEDDSKFSLDQCINNTSTEVFLRPCDSSYSCSTTTKLCAFTQPTQLVAKSYVGEKCNYGVDCINGGPCLEVGICSGSILGADCDDSSECLPGLYCNSASDTCQLQINATKAGCTSDYDCENGSGCNATAKSTGVCYKYFTFSDYSPVAYCPANNINMLCQSGACFQNEKEYYCMPSLTTNGDLPLQCLSSNDCPSNPDPTFKLVFNNTCTCGINTIGASYCSLFPGDELMAEYVAQIKKWLTSNEVYLCNTQQRLGFNCMKSYWDTTNYVHFLYLYATVNNYAKIQGNDKCVQKMFTSEYWGLVSLWNNLNPANYPTPHRINDESGFYFALSILLLAIFS